MLGVRSKSMAALLAHSLARLEAEDQPVKVVTHEKLAKDLPDTPPEIPALVYREESHYIGVMPVPARAERQRHKTKSRKKKAFRL